MQRLIVRHGSEQRVVDLPADGSTVGSAAENDLVLPHKGVSRRHARLHRDGSRVWLVDEGSKNGLVVGGVRHPLVDLEPGVRVALGAAILELRDTAESEADLALVLAPGAPSLPAIANASQTSTLSGVLGGSPAAALQLVRNLERRGRDGDALPLGDVLAATREVLAARSVLLATPDGGRPLSVLACEGQLPGLKQMELLAAQAALLTAGRRRRKHQHRRLVLEREGEETVLVASGADKRYLVAIFEVGAASPPAWARELFDYLADQLLDGGRAVAPRSVLDQAAEADESPELRLPEGMVVGPSPAIRGLLDHVRATVRSHLDVLLIGETGTGKELFARMIHASGPHARGPFVAINCAAIPSELLEAELFGVQARVATGVDARPGHFLQAEGGTIFLDEIGDMEARLQAKLLRVLQEREVLPLGGTQPKKINVRVISASNRNLGELVKAGHFRPDLYYRLRGLQFHIPPLRDRRDDLPALVLAFVERAARAYGKPVRGVSRRALDVLLAHDWPGNVRELASEIERAVLLCPTGGAIESDHVGAVRWEAERGRSGEAPFAHWEAGGDGAEPLAAAAAGHDASVVGIAVAHGGPGNPATTFLGASRGSGVDGPGPPGGGGVAPGGGRPAPALSAAAGARPPRGGGGPNGHPHAHSSGRVDRAATPSGELPLQERIDRLERDAIVSALQRTGGNKSQAAKLLGVTRNGLAIKMTRLGLGSG